MNQNHHNLFDLIGNPVPPHPALDLNGFTPGYVHPHLQTGPIAIHPGTGILPIDEIPVFAGFDLPVGTELPTPTGSRPNKPRRRRTADGDVIKHRRTRNGCYTCRGRRIKCDEGRPICERCKKGSRDCVYPDAPPLKSKSKSPKDSPKSPKSSKHAEGEDEDDLTNTKDEADGSVVSGDALYETEGSQVIKEGSPASIVSQPFSKGKERHPSASDTAASTIGATDDRGQRPRTESFKRVNFEVTTAKSGSPHSSHGTGLFSENPGELESIDGTPLSGEDERAYSQLSPDLRDLMRYHRAHLGFHHYFFRQDATQFVKDLLPTAAMGYEPLLYAMCGFAAFHRAVAQDGKIEDFLGYYQQAVTLLLKSLKSGQEHTESTLLTILQLATFEEYLGDWINLMGHLAAAKELLDEFYTPDSITTTETRRKIFSWYSRFDIYAGMASGHETSLDKKWHVAMERWHYEARAMDTSSVDLQIRWLVSYKRVLSMSLTELSSRTLAGEIEKDEFARQYHDLMKQEAAWGHHLVPLIRAAGGTEPLPDLRTINPDEPDADNNSTAWPKDLERAPCLYLGGAWSVNIMYTDLYATSALQRFNYARIMGLPEIAAEADVLFKEMCRGVDALIQSSSAPEGCILCVQSTLVLIALFMKSDKNYKNWCRRQFFKLEDVGYSIPQVFRRRLAEAWKDPTVCDEWLPNGAKPRAIIKSLRIFNHEREAQPRDQQGQDIKELRGLFSSMSFGGGDTETVPIKAEPSSDREQVSEEMDGIVEELAQTNDKHEHEPPTTRDDATMPRG